MKRCKSTTTKLSDCLKSRQQNSPPSPPSCCSSSAPGNHSSSSSSLLVAFPPTTRNISPVYLPFLYPAQHQQVRHASISVSQSSGKPDPWSFLYGTSEADNLRPPPFNPHFTRSPYRSHDDQPRRKFVSSLSSFQIQRQRANRAIPSTITERERAIFARIFESILSENPAVGGGDPAKDRVARFPSPSLTALFESAVGPQFNRSELTFGPRNAAHGDPTSVTAAMARASAISDYPPSLRAAVAQAAGLAKYAMSEQELKEEGTRQAELVLLMQQMRLCKTDLELNDFLDRHVFSMVGGRDPKPETENANSEAPQEPMKRPRGRPPKSTTLKIEGKKYTFPSQSYADLLFEGMRLLHKTFRDLPGTIAIFERIKRLGAESYVIGCTVSVYNQILEAKWEGYKDISKVEAILEEMAVNGIQGDAGTVEVLRKISAEALRMTNPNAGPWKMGGALLTEGEKECLAKVDSEADRLVAKWKENMRIASMAKKARSGEVAQHQRGKDMIERELMAL